MTTILASETCLLGLEIAEIAELLVAIGTGALAFFTWRLAVRTKDMADQTKIEIDHSRQLIALSQRQADATNAQADIADQTLRATIRPVIVATHEEPRVTMNDDEFAINLALRNIGKGPALHLSVAFEPRTAAPPDWTAISPVTLGPGDDASIALASRRDEKSWDVIDADVKMGSVLIHIIYSDLADRRFLTKLHLNTDARDRWAVSHASTEELYVPPPPE